MDADGEENDDDEPDDNLTERLNNPDMQNYFKEATEKGDDFDINDLVCMNKMLDLMKSNGEWDDEDDENEDDSNVQTGLQVNTFVNDDQ